MRREDLPQMIAVLASTLVQIMVSMKFQVMSGDVRSTERITFNRAMETTVTLFKFVSSCCFS